MPRPVHSATWRISSQAQHQGLQAHSRTRRMRWPPAVIPPGRSIQAIGDLGEIQGPRGRRIGPRRLAGRRQERPRQPQRWRKRRGRAKDKGKAKVKGRARVKGRGKARGRGKVRAAAAVGPGSGANNQNPVAGGVGGTNNLGIGSGDNDVVRDPTRAQVFDPFGFEQGDEERVDFNASDPTGQVKGKALGEGIQNVPLTPYVDRYAEYRQSALGALDRMSVPGHLQDVVRNYFTELGQ